MHTEPLTTISLHTDEQTDKLPEEDLPAGSLSTMAMVEIAVGCFVAVLFLASSVLWVYLCHKARKARTTRKSRSGPQVHNVSHPVYDDVSNFNFHSSMDEPAPKLLSFRRNPAYASKDTQSPVDLTQEPEQPR